VQRVTEGVPAGVFATADADDVTALGEHEVEATDPVKFASNTMTIIVPVGNPKGVKTLADLARSDVKVTLCAAQSSCGAYSTQVLQHAGVAVTPADTADNAGQAVQAVESSAADASIVFNSDVTSSGDADIVQIPPNQNVTAEYVITAIGSADDELQQEFIDFVTGDTAQGILSQFNFGPP
jgi:molybdate transport system substrate-binding protein